MNYIDVCGEKVSEIGLGTANNLEYIKRGLSNGYAYGINYFDTAYSYMNGFSEPTVGSVLSYMRRDKIFVATKREFNHPLFRTESGTLEAIKEQCARLNTPYIDFYMLHGLDGEIGEFENKYNYVLENNIIDHLRAAQSTGIIRHIGFSYHGPGENLTDKVLDRFDFIMVRHNILDDYYYFKRGYTAPYNAANKYKLSKPEFGIINMEVFRKGLFQHMGSSTSASIALGYTLMHHNSVSVCGFRNSYQIEKLMKMYNEKGDDLYNDGLLYDKMIDYLRLSDISTCYHCGKCSVKSLNIPVSKLRDLYNQYILSNKITKLKNYMKEFDLDRDYSSIGCISPEPINDFMKKLKELQ